MRSKPKKSDCGFCEQSCNTEWCPSKEEETPLILFRKEVSKEELERRYPKKRTESEEFIYDLIRYHGGFHD